MGYDLPTTPPLLACELNGQMDRLLDFGLSRIVSTGNLEVVTPSGRYAFGDGSGTPVVARFHDSRAVFAFMADPDMKLGELFMDGRLTMEAGSIFDLLYLLLRDSRQGSQPLIGGLLDRARLLARQIQRANSPSRSRRNVAHHYDLDDRLYRLFLDADMQYSCAYFYSPDVDLETAQLAKKRHIAAKLCIERDHSVLDIGCGWGGLALYLSNIAGAGSVLGITLSEEQLRVAQTRKTECRQSRSIQFALADYREIAGTFDRIVSVGMFEHVGASYYDRFFAGCHRLLADDGIMLLHTIGCSASPGFVMPWLNKYIFPGAHVPSLSEIVPVIERRGFVISDLEILQRHYALTLRSWRERFLERRQEAVELYDERFCRMWEFYLAAGEVAFLCEDANVFQLQLTKKPGVTSLTRSYMASRELALQEVERRWAAQGDAGRADKSGLSARLSQAERTPHD
jgi:cyclopropane-fatty-acyl-phospholipid synthase